MGLTKNFSDVSFVADVEEWKNCIRADHMDGLFMTDAQGELSDGETFFVMDGQAALVIKDGAISDFTAEAGAYEFQEQMPPTVFGGKFGDRVKNSIDCAGNCLVNTSERRVYYINLAEISGIKFGFGELPFTAPDLQKDIMIRCYGTYSCTVSDPILFLVKFFGKGTACGATEIAQTLREPLGKASTTAASKLSEKKTPSSSLADEIGYFSEQVRLWANEETKFFGIELTALAVEALTPDENSIREISGVSSEETEFDAEWERVLREEKEATASASPAPAQIPAQAQQTPAPEPAQAQQTPPPAPVQEQQTPPPEPAQTQQAPDAGAPDSWTCSCGMVNTMNFCPQCGAKKPDKPKCAHCGFEFPESMAAFKFCPNCGTPKE